MKTFLVLMSTLLAAFAMSEEDALIRKMESIQNNQQMLEDNLQKHQEALQQHIYEHQKFGRHSHLDPIHAGIDLNEEMRSKPKRTLISPVRQYVHHYKVRPVALKYVVGYHVPSNRYLPVRRPSPQRPLRPSMPARPIVHPGFVKPDFQQIDTPSIRPPQKPEQGHSLQIPIHSVQGTTVQIQAPLPSPSPTTVNVRPGTTAVAQPTVTPVQVVPAVSTVPAHIHPTQVHFHPSHTHHIPSHLHHVQPTHVQHVHPSHIHYHHLIKPVVSAVQPTVVIPQTPVIKVPSITVNPVLPLPRAVFHNPYPVAVAPAPVVPALPPAVPGLPPAVSALAPAVPVIPPAIPAVPAFPNVQYPNVFPPVLRGFPLQPTFLKPGHSFHTSYSATFPKVPIVQNTLTPLLPNPALHTAVPIVPNGPFPFLPNPVVPNHSHLIHNHIDLPHSHQVQHEISSVPHLHENVHQSWNHIHYPYKH